MTDKTAERVEELARAECAHDGAKWDAAHFGETPNGETPEEMREYYRDRIYATLPIIDRLIAEAVDQAVTNHRYELASAYASGRAAGIAKERAAVVALLRKTAVERSTRQECDDEVVLDYVADLIETLGHLTHPPICNPPSNVL